MNLTQSVFAASLFLAVAAAGCATTTEAVDTNNNKAIVDVEISPGKDTLTTGTSLQFHATAQYADGTHKEVTRESGAIWNTSNPRIATVSTSGLVTAIKVGLVDISVEYQGVKTNEHFAVTP